MTTGNRNEALKSSYSDNAETRQTIAVIRAMTKNGPTRWAGNPPIEAKDDKPRHKSRHNEKETKNND